MSRISKAMAFVLIAFMVSQVVAGNLYWWTHPDLTKMQVFQAIDEWSIPARWM